MKISLEPIGFVSSTRSEVRDDEWDSETSYIELTNALSPEALTGLDSFSHVEVIFYMNQVKEEKIQRAARRPRNNPDWPMVGILAQRGKNRLNRLGLTVCRVLKVEAGRLYLQGLDAVDGTPVLDVKPWVKEFGPRGDLKQPEWISELMTGYWSAS